MPLPNTRQPELQRKELEISVVTWKGMMSALPLKAVPPDAFSYLLNMYFDGPNKVKTRPGSALYTNNDVFGAGNSVIGSYEFKQSFTAAKLITLISDGKLYQQSGSGTPVLIGQLDNLTPIQVGFAMLADKLYIADGVSAYRWDGVVLTNINDTFPTFDGGDLGNIVDVTNSRSQIWWADDGDYIYSSAFNDPDDLMTEENGAWKLYVSRLDGMRIANLVRWGNTLIINKVEETTYQQAMYWLRGTGPDDYRVEALIGDPKSPTAFVGRSAVQIGTDVLGLTLDGITTVSAINNFREAKSDSISDPIMDVIQRINFGVSHKICGVYDTVTQQYLCAVPLDGAVFNNAILVYDIRGDRWSLYDNWPVRSWVRVGSDILYGNENGELVKIRTGESDRGSGYNKIAEGGNLHFNGPDIIKLFKSVEIDITHEGQYNIIFSAIIDDYEFNARPIPLSLDARSVLFDVAHYDVDFYDIQGDTNRSVYVQSRGKYIRPKFQNSNVDEAFTLNSVTYRIFQKDAGTPRAA